MANQLKKERADMPKFAKRGLAVIGGGLLTAGTAMAQTAPVQPDVTEVVTYMLGSVATIALIGNASLIVRVALRVYGWVRSSIK